MRALLLVAAVTVAAVRPASGTQVPVEPGPRVAQLRLDGYVGPPAPGRSSAADLVLEHAGRRIRFQAESARVLQGDRSGQDFLDEVSADPPKLILQGPDEVLAKLEQAQPGDRVVLTGYHRSGSRTFALSSVEVEPARR
jgi:hypothetical protein